MIFQGALDNPITGQYDDLFSEGVGSVNEEELPLKTVCNRGFVGFPALADFGNGAVGEMKVSSMKAS